MADKFCNWQFNKHAYQSHRFFNPRECLSGATSPIWHSFLTVSAVHFEVILSMIIINDAVINYSLSRFTVSFHDCQAQTNSLKHKSQNKILLLKWSFNAELHFSEVSLFGKRWCIESCECLQRIEKYFIVVGILLSLPFINAGLDWFLDDW